jgi:hypothetical protein
MFFLRSILFLLPEMIAFVSRPLFARAIDDAGRAQTARHPLPVTLGFRAGDVIAARPIRWIWQITLRFSALHVTSAAPRRGYPKRRVP